MLKNIPRKCPVCDSTKLRHNQKGDLSCERCGYKLLSEQSLQERGVQIGI
jgi:ribosomal protein L37AE/L43A